MTTKAKEFMEGLIGPLTLGKAMKANREAYDISQKDMADTIGISRQYLCDIEKGRKMPKIEDVPRIAACFKMGVELALELYFKEELAKAGQSSFDVNITKAKRA